MADGVKVYYFKIAGRAEVLRLLLAAGGKKWEDIRFAYEEWPTYKPEAPFGQAPFVDIGGKKYGQSVAIANYLAREYGFAGKNNLEGLRIDEVVQLLQDLVAVMFKAGHEKDEAKKAELMEKVKKEDVPKYLGFFEKLLKENGTGYFVGKQLSLADIAVFDMVENSIKGQALNITDAVENFPLVKGVCAKVKENPGIKKYLEEQAAKK